MWEQIRHFTPAEKWGDPYAMDLDLVLALDQLREDTGRRVVVHCGREDRPSGWHPTGRAVDIHINGMDLVDQYLAAERYPAFTGIGVYPWWNNPGLHLDTRPLETGQQGARWGSTGEGVYVPMDSHFLMGNLTKKGFYIASHN
jgi:uncharacterized protein YcbK (DUF882 family)